MPPAPEPRVEELEAQLERTAPGYLARVRAARAALGLRAEESTDAQAALAAVDETAVIDLAVPTASRRRAARVMKVGVRKLIRWYLRYITSQVTAFGHAVSHLGSMLVERTERVESATARLEAELGRLSERVERLEKGGRTQT